MKIKNIINTKATIKQSIQLLNKIGKKCLVVVDEKNFLIGTLSDGDLSKAILNGQHLDNKIDKIYLKVIPLIRNPHNLNHL